MKKLMTSWERRESARTGKPIDQVLHELIEASGGKWEVIGAITGMTRPSAVRMFSRNGIVKQPARNIDYEGKNASLLQHCRDHGLKYFCVKGYVKRNKVSPQAAMDAYRAGAVRRVYWGKPQ